MAVLQDPEVPDVEKVRHIQMYIDAFEYNYSGKPFVKLNKKGGAKHLLTATLELIRLALPIQCVEAVFIGGWLSKDLHAVERVPLSFKSTFRGNVHRHIVLAVRVGSRWGSVGISRRQNLMDKPVVYESLTHLISDYEAAYAECFHQLLTVYLGLPLPRTFQADDRPIKWRAAKVRVWRTDPADTRERVEAYCAVMHRMAHSYSKYGRLTPG